MSGEYSLGEVPYIPGLLDFRPGTAEARAGSPWATPLPFLTRLERLVPGRPLKLSILMAVYNEERTIGRVIDEILKAKCPCEIELIVVDDGSTDRTPILLSRVDDPRVIVFHHPANQGKGAASSTQRPWRLARMFFRSTPIWSTNQKIFQGFLSLYLKGRCEVVYGARLFGCNTVYQTYLYAVGNRLLTRMANVLFNAHLTDLHTCLKLMPLATLKSLNLREKGFGLDSEITASLLRQGIRPFEVPISYYGRSHAEGKKIKWRDAVACARILLRVRLRARSGWEPASPRQGEDESSRVCDSRAEQGCDRLTDPMVNGCGSAASADTSEARLPVVALVSDAIFPLLPWG